MRKKILPISFFVILALFISCETAEKIDDFPLYPSKLVLNCVLNPDDSLSVHISKSLSVLDNADISGVNDATVKIYENGNLLNTLTTSDGNGYYINSSIFPNEGSTYKIEASSPSLDSAVSASTYIPYGVDVNSLKVTEIVEDYDYYYYYTYNFEVSLDDPSGETNFYMLRFKNFVFDYNIIGTDTSYYIYDNGYVYLDNSNNSATDEITSYAVFFKDEIFNGKTYSFDVTCDYLETYCYQVKIVAELYALSEEEYKYRKSKAIFDDNYSNPLSEPVQVYNNINGGYGIFCGQSKRESDTAVIDGNNW